MNQIPISVADVTQALAAGFTHIEVWKSEDLGNSYQPLTAASSSYPILDGLPATTTYRVGGRTLLLDFSGTRVEFLFGSLFELWTPQQVADAMNNTRPGCAVVYSDYIRVLGTGVGRGQFVSVVSTPDGLFIPGKRVVGVDAFLPLVPGTVIYSYQDLAPATKNDRYRWRLSANGLAPFSEMASYVKAVPAPLDPATVTIGYARFVGIDGSPARGRLLIAEDGAAKPNSVMVSSGPLIIEADEAGFLQARLLKGAKLRIAIEGTSISRIITVPDVPSFDIMAALSDVPDGFTPATTTPLLTRRSI